MALLETPASQYTIVYNDDTGEHQIGGDRGSTEAAIGKLRGEGRHWRLYARAPAATSAPAAPAAGSTSSPANVTPKA
jgi:hypothetical protein